MYPSSLATWLLSFVLLIAGVGALLYFAAGDNTSGQKSETFTVAATIHPLYDIARQIAGEDARVVRILPPGASPHTFELTPSSARELAQAHAVFGVGHELDTWITHAAQQANTEVIVVDRGITLKDSLEHATHEHDHQHEHGADDPHYWLSLENSKVIAATIAAELARLDPANKAGFESRRDTFIASIESLEMERAVSSVSISDLHVITLHDAWQYFVDELGVEVVGAIEPTAGTEPTPRYLLALKEEAEEHNVQLVIAEPQLANASLMNFARDNNLTVIELDPLGGSEGRETYQELMRFNFEALMRAHREAFRAQ